MIYMKNSLLNILAVFALSFSTISFSGDIFDAIESSDKTRVKFLIDQGIDLNEADYKGRTPLYLVAKEGDVSQLITIISLLIEKGAQVNKAKNNGKTPLWIAIHNGQLETTILLIEKGADIHRAANSGINPFWAAVYRQRHEIVSLLMGKNVEINITDDQGKLLKHVVPKQIDRDMRRLFFANGVNIMPILARRHDRYENIYSYEWLIKCFNDKKIKFPHEMRQANIKFLHTEHSIFNDEECDIKLPLEILLLIFYNFDFIQLVSLSIVSKQFYNILDIVIKERGIPKAIDWEDVKQLALNNGVRLTDYPFYR